MAETVVPAPGLEHRGTGEYRKHNQHSTRFPRCKLYGDLTLPHSAFPRCA